MVEWVKVASNVAVGGGVGAVDQLVQNADKKREEEREEKLPIMSQYGTYFNYGVPILAILGTAFGFLKGDWATRLVTAGSQLAGRKITHQITKKNEAVSWTPWKRDRAAQLEARRQAALEAARRKGGARPQVDTGDLGVIPIVAEEAILV